VNAASLAREAEQRIAAREAERPTLRDFRARAERSQGIVWMTRAEFDTFDNLLLSSGANMLFGKPIVLLDVFDTQSYITARRLGYESVQAMQRAKRFWWGE
jgi:hypothetical protein